MHVTFFTPRRIFVVQKDDMAKINTFVSICFILSIVSVVKNLPQGMVRGREPQRGHGEVDPQHLPSTVVGQPPEALGHSVGGLVQRQVAHLHLAGRVFIVVVGLT